jgi:hypothetical protein
MCFEGTKTVRVVLALRKLYFLAVRKLYFLALEGFVLEAASKLIKASPKLHKVCLNPCNTHAFLHQSYMMHTVFVP